MAYNYVPAKPQVVVDTKNLVLTINGVPQMDAEGKPILDEAAWLKIRRGGIGGSDASTIVGTSPWRTRQQLMDDKRDISPMKAEKKNQMPLTIGHMFEGVIRYKTVPYLLNQIGITNFRIEEDTHMYQHGNPDYSFARADIDGLILINGVLGGLEIKTTNWRNIATIEEWKSGVVPPYYEAQVRHYMAIMNLPFFYICCAWGFNPEDEAVLIKIDRDMNLEAQLMNEEREFWEEHVIAGELVKDEDCSPSIVRDYYGRRVVRNNNETPVPLDENQLIPLVAERESILDRINNAKKDLSNAQEELAAVEVAIMQQFDSNDANGSYMKDANHKVFVTCKSKLANKSYDLEEIKKNLPDIYDKASEVKFSASKLTASEKALITPYQLPQLPNGKVDVSVREYEVDANGKPVRKKKAV